MPYRWLLSCCCVCASGLMHAAALDPLNPAEISRALQQAVNATPAVSRTRALSLNTPEPELLLVERRPQEKGSTQRLADVYTYDYSTDTTLITVVDVDTNTVVSSQHQQNLQLPLTANELQRAADLVFNDDEQRDLLNREFQRITGKPLTNPQTQLEVKAFVFHASSLPEQLNAASQRCGLSRCAQVLLYTADNVVFEVSPIVNLSAGVITQNIGF